jgi:hypothetical protein
MIRRLYSDPTAPSAFSTLKKLHEAVKQTISKKTERKKTHGKVKVWLETQDAYKLLRPVKNAFLETLTALLTLLTYGNWI